MFVTEDELEQLDFLLEQSIQGAHHLFERRLVWATMKAEGERDFSMREVKKVQQLLNRMVVQPTIALKRAYISKLREDEKKLLIRSYFNIVENTIYDSQSEYH